MHADEQAEEAAWWGDCANTFGEELKQFQYAELMGLRLLPSPRGPYQLNGEGLSWLDFGGGPTSMLLRFGNTTDRGVLDPLKVPDWVKVRYRECGIRYAQKRCDVPGIPEPGWKTAQMGLCYNVLQHVEDPEQFVRNMLAMTGFQCVFEWIDIPPHPGHPNMLTQEKLESWFGQTGNVGELRGENECYGRYWALPLLESLRQR